MTRSVLNTFASLTNPTLPNLDADFLGVANTLVVPCTVTGTNALSLTPVTSTVNVTAYTDKDQYTFIAVATSTGSMTLQVSGLGLVNLYKSGGTVQAGSGDVVSGQFYQVAYQAALNSGQGGFVIVSAILSSRTARTRQVLTGGSGLTYTTPANALYLNIRMMGGGGGGGGTGTSGATAGGTGGNTVFSTLISIGGSGGNAGTAAVIGTGGNGGGTGGSPNISITGGNGAGSSVPGGTLASNIVGGSGGDGPFGGAGLPPTFATGGGSAAPNSGAGASGADGNASAYPGGGGGAAGYVETLITTPAATYLYTVASGGVGGAQGASGAGAGGVGGSGIIIVDEFYQ